MSVTSSAEALDNAVMETVTDAEHINAGANDVSYPAVSSPLAMDEHSRIPQVDMAGDNGEPAIDHADGDEGPLEPHADDQAEYEKLQAICGEGQTKYDLRPQARETKADFSRTWIDDDQTGYYDPEEERRKLRQRPKRPNTLLKCGFKPWEFNESEESNEPAKEHVPKPEPRLDVTLSFRSEEGKASFAKHVQNLPAKPDPSEELFSERRLRRRDSGVGFSHFYGGTATKRRRSLSALPEDLTGHPAARGCRECLNLGLRCPLLNDERAWPCATCVDDDNECELVTPPQYKRPCEHCKGKRIGCSYTYTSDHAGPCEECACTAWRCVAGPFKDAIRERISYDRDWESDPYHQPRVPKPKKLPSCRRCLERKQPCSFAAGDKGDVCTACDMANEACQPELPTKSSRKRKREQAGDDLVASKSSDNDDKAARDADLNEDSRKKLRSKPFGAHDFSSDSDYGSVTVPAPETAKAQPIMISSGEDNSSSEGWPETPPPTENSTRPGHKQQAKQNRTRKLAKQHKQTRTHKDERQEEGTLETISTKFAHPIKFNHEGKEPCHFCSDIRFAMFGLGPTEVEVVVWRDGRDLDEVSGGHRGQGIENTRMCVACTTARMPMVMCARHVLRPLQATANDTDQNNLALARLLNGSATGTERWCSVCPALAKYQCCTQGPHGKGCGLLLCEACMVAVVAENGSLDRTLKYLKDEPSEERMLGLRADVELLKRDGLLMRYVVCAASKAAQPGRL